MKELERDKEREKFSILPKWPQELGLDQAEARNLELHLIFHVFAVAQVLGPFSSAFSGTMVENCLGRATAGPYTGAHVECWHYRI